MSDIDSIQQRKREHLETCLQKPVEFVKKTTWFEHVELVHQAVPAFSPSEVNISVKWMGRTLSAPFFIGAITGGTKEAGEINRVLARIASEKGIGLALGSQRPMMQDAALKTTYEVRNVAPDILLLGNIGLSQAMKLKPAEVRRLMNSIGADGMCLHLNPAMEMFQKEGDEPQGKALAAIGKLADELGDRLVIKETGCGISRETARALAKQGVRTIDVAGAGGTSWVKVEYVRNPYAAPNYVTEYEEWGIPTAASILEARGLGARIVSSGGVRNGLDLAKSIALGADLGSAALPALVRLHHEGEENLRQWIDDLTRSLRVAMVLCGCRDLKSLKRTPVVLSGQLLNWAEQRKLGRKTRG